MDDGDEVAAGSDPTAQADVITRPVGIIIAADGSSSMRAEIQGIESFIGGSFAEHAPSSC